MATWKQLPQECRVEWRIDINQINRPGELIEERREKVSLVAPDQPIAPVRIMSSAVESKGLLALLRAFVNRFDRLQW